MKKIVNTITSWIKKVIKAITPGADVFKGAANGLLIATILVFLSASIIKAISINDPWIFVFYLGFTLLFGLLGIGIHWALKLIIKIPRLFRFALIVSYFVITTILYIDELAYAILIVSSVLGASVFILTKTKFKNISLLKKIISLLALSASISCVVAGIVYYFSVGIEVKPIINASFTSKAKVEHILLESPSSLGGFKVKTLYYGSGKDKHRKHFGENVDIKTDSVNGVAFLDNWEGISGWWRTKYWGFDYRSLPLNGQVWYPEGDGPFPLVLIVHGNHSMQDFSDTGYEYLGKLLASRGMIAVSVDENFLNSSWSDEFSGGLKRENDARGWILLEHLRLWHKWNLSRENPFYGKVDTEKLSLIGHSRGGEAVAHAALLNKLPYYSDDATIKLDYNYNIKSIVAIAPVDGQYKPGGTRTKLEDINYFVIHGAQDADVDSYAGSLQFDRIKFTNENYTFKSGLYVYGANHGQFNTSWGNNDVGTPFTGLLNLKQLLEGEEQREIAKVYISAFLEATLREDKRYLPLFVDSRAGKKWLPETIYINQFEDSNTRFLATFEEDFDVTTLSTNQVKVSSNNLTVWKEKMIPLKWRSKESRGLFLGWYYKKKDKAKKKNDSLQKNKEKLFAPVHDSLIANYRMTFQKPISNLDSTSVFVFSMAESKEGSNPKSSGKWLVKKTTKKDKTKPENKVENKPKNKLEKSKKTDKPKEIVKKGKEPIDFSISFKDNSGSEVYFPISNFSKLQRRLGVKILKTDYNDNEKSENVMQLFSFPLKDMLKINPSFNFSDISEVQFIFDRTDKGVIVIDNVGFMKNIESINQ